MAVGDNATATALEKLGILQVVDLRASTPAQVYAAQKTKLSTRMAIWQPDDGGKAEHLSDYAVFGRIPTVEHSEAKAATVRAVLAGIDSTKLSAHMGWTGWDEHTWVASISAVGGYAHASDFVYYYRLSNLGLMLTGFVFFCLFFSTAPPPTRSSWCTSLPHADWCLQSDIVPDQRFTSAGIEHGVSCQRRGLSGAGTGAGAAGAGARPGREGSHRGVRHLGWGQHPAAPTQRLHRAGTLWQPGAGRCRSGGPTRLPWQS